ncbi:hypothetical protein BDY19DRAFT_984557 [Irpex rosettiformis]|uniref:Uncharacterized protein n=1 Tax=Irpex rosettiformis TaxID=378272 RepID=A0ACB8U7L7_9APHY|nr:hypothetical protein BDY19DRAFT_984557 [Irpex rosettiformis]
MRESNFAFPAQNRACVCITSQLYDRRALDTNAPLPLYNSLSHLTYLTSTSPRIREIMTMDGGLERLVRILHDFCICPPPPENPAILYGLSAPKAHPSKLIPTLNPKSFDKQAAYRFSLAFQSVVNIGVRGSEQIRGRVVQAGTLEVVGCILEAWLAGKGFAVGPNATAGGMHRETREQRMARRQAQHELRQREQAQQLARALQRQVTAEQQRRERSLPSQEIQEDDVMDTEPSSDGRDTSTEPSSHTTPLGTNTPTGTVTVPSRDRSGTIIARPVWDQTPTIARGRTLRQPSRSVAPSASEGPSATHSADNSRPDTETEDDGDVDMDHDSMRESDAPISGASSPERQDLSGDAGTIRATTAHPRRAVGIVSDTGPTAAGASMDMTADAHIIINDQTVAVEGVGVEDGIVSLETNDDFAMGAPPGAPGAITPGPTRGEPHPAERTPRAGTITLPPPTTAPVPPVPATMRGRNADGVATAEQRRAGAPVNPRPGVPGAGVHHHHHHRDSDTGPYRDEDVLLALQLLAYLSKYPHVRQAFYKPRSAFHPATLQENSFEDLFKNQAGPSTIKPQATSSTPAKEPNAFLKAFANATGRGKEKATATAGISQAPSTSTVSSSTPSATRMTNVFSLVERFTYRPSSSEMEGPNPPPTLPPEIQYWAGVIMRNACRKDDSRGGIRQCANMMCGKWESFPREFAKCRRCRKAKYCGKECQSIAWSEGHRFWCSVRDPEDGEDRENQAGRAERRAQREQERAARVQALEAQLADEFQRPGRVVVAVPPGANPPPVPAAINVVAPEGTRARAGNVPAAFGNWTFSPLTLRRVRRPEEGPANTPEAPNAAANSVTIRWRSRDNGDAPNDLQHQISFQPDVGPSDGVQVAVQTDAGPSHLDNSTDVEDAMIIE